MSSLDRCFCFCFCLLSSGMDESPLTPRPFIYPKDANHRGSAHYPPVDRPLHQLSPYGVLTIPQGTARCTKYSLRGAYYPPVDRPQHQLSPYGCLLSPQARYHPRDSKLTIPHGVVSTPCGLVLSSVGPF